MEQSLIFRSKINSDTSWIIKVAEKLWGSIEIVSKKHTYNILKLPSFIAVIDGKPVGFIMHVVHGRKSEIVALYSEYERQGIGTKLLDLVKEDSKRNGCTAVWILTTNDNTHALRYYQKRGFAITAIRINAIETQRKVKPIPLLGNDDIPIRDEIELEINL